jgi:peroxiredoxin
MLGPRPGGTEDDAMARTHSGALPLGTPAPDFALPDPDGKIHRLADFADAPALVVAFICNHCPYVQHIREELARFARDVAARGVGVVAINPNDFERYPADAPPRMAEEARRFGYAFPYLYDERQEVTRAYRAACTPEFALFDGARRLAYRGRFDASRPGSGVPVTGADLRAAVDAVLAGRRCAAEQAPSMGCSIKWKPGREPEEA